MVRATGDAGKNAGNGRDRSSIGSAFSFEAISFLSSPSKKRLGTSLRQQGKSTTGREKRTTDSKGQEQRHRTRTPW